MAAAGRRWKRVRASARRRSGPLRRAERSTLRRRPQWRPTQRAASEGVRLRAIGSHPKHAPNLPSASPRKLPNRPTVQAPARGRVRQPRENAHGPPDGGRMVNGVRTDMVNEWLIGRAATASLTSVERTQALIQGGFPDAVQRVSGAPLIRDRRKHGAYEGPGSAAHHSATLRAALRPGNEVITPSP